MYLLVLCVRGNNGIIAISYLQQRLVAATDHCCACKQLAPAPRKLTLMIPSLVRSLVCSLPSLFASIVLRMYYTSQVKVLKAAVSNYVRDIRLIIFDSEPKSRMQLIYTSQLWRASVSGFRPGCGMASFQGKYQVAFVISDYFDGWFCMYRSWDCIIVM